MKYIKVLVCFLCALRILYPTIAQETEWKAPGNCDSYSVNGNEVVFDCDSGQKISLKFLNSEVIKVWYDPEGVFERQTPSFAVINEDLSDLEIKVNEQQQVFEIYTETLRVRVNKSPFNVQIFDKYQKLILGDYQDKGLVFDGAKKVAFKKLREHERFYGLGEKAGPINRRGREYTMWNSDVPCYSPDQDPLYKSIPFFVSSLRYGIFFDNTYKTKFKFGSDSDKYFSFETPGGEMVYYFIHGKDYKAILSSYTELTGKPIMPPKWAFGFSQSRGLYTKEKQALEIAKAFREREIPIDIIYQDIGWTEHLQDFEWRRGNYENPVAMLDSLRNNGFKMIVSQDPVISQANEKQWQEANDLGYLVLDKRTGKAYDMPWPWGGNAAVVDFTKPEVADWWGRYQQKPLDDGVSGFWTDMGEPAWSNEEDTDRLHMKHHLGMHSEIHNVYGLTWDKVVKEQFEKRNPNKRIFQMTRAAYAGLQRYTFGWSGDSGNGMDVLSGWKNLANQIPLSLSAGMGLVPFWATDISGYCGDITDYGQMAELYIRWLQFGVFNPLSRAHHEGDNAVEPWLFGKEAEKIAKATIELKYQLFPYIYTYGREAFDTGVPLMRAMFLEYPNDEKAAELDHQFMLGEYLLVAPVVEKGAESKNVYLPEGEWVDFHDQRTVYKGGQEIKYRAPLDVVPLFVKRGAAIPTMPVMQYIHEVEDYPVIWEVFPKKTGGSAFELYEDDGVSNDYKNDEFSVLKLGLDSGDNQLKINMTSDNKNGFEPAQHHQLVKVHLNGKPKNVMLMDEKVKQTKVERLLEEMERESEKACWAWEAAAEICYIWLPEKSALNVTVNY